MASDQPRKLFVGGLSADTSEKDLKGIFCVFGHIAEVILLKNGETKRSRGFAFITFDSPADAQCAAKEMNGKLLDGKVIKVEPAGKPSSANYGRGTEPPISRNRVTQRSLSYGRGGYDGTRGHSSSEGNFGGSRYSPIFNMSSPRRPLLVKRIPFPRIASPPPKRSNRSAAVGSSFKVREQVIVVAMMGVMVEMIIPVEVRIKTQQRITILHQLHENSPGPLVETVVMMITAAHNKMQKKRRKCCKQPKRYPFS
ncbi:RNA-binding motif protein, Y chromosome, family 9-like isoform 2-T5 [Thomomys bottae]